MTRRTEIDMLNGPLTGKIWRFALPIAASAFLQQLFNAADNAVVGNFAKDPTSALGAVGGNAFVIGLMVNLFVGMSVGANVGSSGSSGMVGGECALMMDKTAKLTFLADGAQIFVGDEVLTSGSGGAFPAGLVIGTISNVQTEAGGQIEYGIVTPQCELDSLVQVFIIKDFEVVE